MNFSQVNYDAMTGPQLVEQYNQMARTLGRDAVRKFESKRVAVARCETLRAILTDVITDVTPKKRYTAMDGIRDVLHGADADAVAKRVHDEAPKKSAPVRTRTVISAPGKPTQVTLKKSAERDARVIKILTKDEANPRREGTDASRHFEAMRGGRTVAEYLDQFDADRRKVARHWLYNTVKDGYVSVEPNDEEVR